MQALVFNFLKIKLKTSCCLSAAKLRVFSFAAVGYSSHPTNSDSIPKLNETSIFFSQVFTHLSIVNEVVYIEKYTPAEQTILSMANHSLATVVLLLQYKSRTLAFSGRRY